MSTKYVTFIMIISLARLYLEILGNVTLALAELEKRLGAAHGLCVVVAFSTVILLLHVWALTRSDQKRKVYLTKIKSVMSRNHIRVIEI